MPPALPAARARRLAYYALLVCALTVAAAAVSFARGNWLGVVWVLLAGLSSNMAWYFLRRSRTPATRPVGRNAERQRQRPDSAAAAP